MIISASFARTKDASSTATLHSAERVFSDSGEVYTNGLWVMK